MEEPTLKQNVIIVHLVHQKLKIFVKKVYKALELVAHGMISVGREKRFLVVPFWGIHGEKKVCSLCDCSRCDH